MTHYLKNTVSSMALLAALSPAAFGAVIVPDGKLDSTDGTTYQLGYSVGFVDTSGNAIGNGRLYFGINSSDNTQFLYFQMPLSYVDNTYGANAAADWGGGGHTFSDLLGSDALGSAKKGGIGFTWLGNSVAIDYIAGACTTVGKTTTCTYRSGGVGTALNDGATTSNDGAIISGSASSMLEIATSLEYDLALFPAQTTDSGTDPAWIKEVGYEVQFAANTFNPALWLSSDAAASLIGLGTPHASPSKQTFSSYNTPSCILGCGPADVPEPGGLSVLGAALGALGWAGRRRRAQAPPG